MLKQLTSKIIKTGRAHTWLKYPCVLALALIFGCAALAGCATRVYRCWEGAVGSLGTALDDLRIDYIERREQQERWEAQLATRPFVPARRPAARITAAALAACMLFTLLPVTAFGAQGVGIVDSSANTVDSGAPGEGGVTDSGPVNKLLLRAAGDVTTAAGLVTALGGAGKAEAVGETVTLLQSVNLNATITIAADDSTLDLGGFDITGATGANGKGITPLTLTGGALTVTGTTGSITGGDSTSGFGGAGIKVTGGSLTVSGGSIKGGVGGFKGGYGIYLDPGIRLTVSGGSITGGDSTGSSGGHGVYGAYGAVTITGGAVAITGGNGGNGGSGGSSSRAGGHGVNGAVTIDGGTVAFTGGIGGIGGNGVTGVTGTGVTGSITLGEGSGLLVGERDDDSTFVMVEKGTDGKYTSAKRCVLASPRPTAPTGVAGVACTTEDNNDGKLTGVSTLMEYKSSTDAAYTAITGDTVTGLVPGSYDVRLKATQTNFESAVATPIVGAYDPTLDRAAVAAAKAAIVNGEVNVAFGADQATKTAAVQSYVNGLLANTPGAAGVTATVSHSSGNSYTVALKKGGATDTKTITMTITESNDPDAEAVAAAIAAVEGTAFTTTQANSPTKEASKRYAEDAAKAAVGSGITVEVVEASYTAPTAGTAANPSGTNGSYVFTVTVSKGNQSQTTAQQTATITATPYTGGGSGGGSSGDGGDSSSTPPTQDEPKAPTKGEIKLTANVDANGNATATVTEQAVSDAIQKAENTARQGGNLENGIALVLSMDTGSGAANSISVNLPKLAQEAIINKKIVSTLLVINNPDIQIGMDLAAMRGINTQAKADVSISATRMGSAQLTGAAKTAIGSRPAFDLKATFQNGAKSVTGFGGGMVSVAIPYTLQAGESASGVYAVYVDAAGAVSYLLGSSYDAGSKLLRFSTSHFSVYGIGYKAPASFADTTAHWARADIDFVATRGLMSGTGKTAFAPDGPMTRAVLVTALGRLAGIDSAKYKATSFTDVPADASYAPYVAWAVEKGIAAGTSATTFGPNQTVTRQELAVFMARYAKATGYKLPAARAAVTFADSSAIASWASADVKQMQMAGVLNGKNGNQLDPTGAATRAEAAALLHRYVKLVIDPATAQGWTTNDSGTAMLYENGRPVKNQTRTANGSAYAFNSYGEVALPTESKKYLLHKVKKDEYFYTISKMYGCTQEELMELNGLQAGDVVHPGDTLKVPAK